MQIVKTSVVSLLLSLLVLAGTWLPLWASPPLWVALVIAAVSGLVAGVLAPSRITTWLAVYVLVLLTWIFYVVASIYGFPRPQIASFAVYPLSASVSVATGLILRRAHWSNARWRAVPVALGAALVIGLGLLHEPLLAWGTPGSYPAPEFVLKHADETMESSQALRGKTVVLAFWATWCGPCLQEVPALNALYWKDYANRTDVRFFLVDEDSGPHAANEAAAWLAAHHITMPSVLDSDGKVQNAFKTYGIVPTRIVVSPSGQVSLTQLGYSGSDAKFSALRGTIDELAR